MKTQIYKIMSSALRTRSHPLADAQGLLNTVLSVHWIIPIHISICKLWICGSCSFQFSVFDNVLGIFHPHLWSVRNVSLHPLKDSLSCNLSICYFICEVLCFVDQLSVFIKYDISVIEFLILTQSSIPISFYSQCVRPEYPVTRQD